MDLIKWVQEHFPHIGVIMISGEDDAEVAVKALEEIKDKKFYEIYGDECKLSSCPDIRTTPSSITAS